MADYLRGLFGGQQAAPSASSDDDFADFAGAPDPSPASIAPEAAQSVSAFGAEPTSGSPVLYTKWYRVWERTSPKDFQTEAFILPFIVLIVGLHIWGRRANKRKAKGWITAHAPALQKEYALVGFGAQKASTEGGVQDSDELAIPAELLKEKTAQEYVTYATGRQNVAFTDVTITMFKRYNPATLLIEFLLSLVFDTMQAPSEHIDVTTYTFDGREKDLVPARSQEQKETIEAQAKSRSSVYDPCVWAVVHKDNMKNLRDDRYDISLTSTKENAKLPNWVVIMSESAEITEQLLTPELITAVEKAGDAFRHLIVTDQPLDKPAKLDETKPRKRLSLSLNMPSDPQASAYDSSLPLFNYFLRMPDQLASKAHFRSEVNKKIRTVREEEQRKLIKATDDERAEERKIEGDKKKKEMRDEKMRGMSAEEQRKFLEKERERSGKKQEKRMSKKA